MDAARCRIDGDNDNDNDNASRASLGGPSGARVKLRGGGGELGRVILYFGIRVLFRGTISTQSQVNMVNTFHSLE